MSVDRLISSSKLPPNLDLHRRKILCVDDRVSNLELEERWNFLRGCNLKEEDVFFANAYEPALEILEQHQEIGLVFVDIRIPRKSEDLLDFNENDPTQGWGSSLLKALTRQYKNRDLKIIIITAYPNDYLSNPELIKIGDAFFEKPLNYTDIVNEINRIITEFWLSGFEYNVLDEELSAFVKEKTIEINSLAKETIENTVKIGNYLIEIRRKLEHGSWQKWLKTEFIWDERTAQRLIRIANEFKKPDSLSGLNISISALYILTAPSMPKEAKKEVLSKAKEGETITPVKVLKTKEKYIKEEQVQSKSIKALNTEQKDEEIEKKQVSVITEQKTLIEPQSVTTKQEKEISSLSKPIQIISVQHQTIKNSFWKLGNKHTLFCGEPQDEKFIKILPQNIALYAAFPPNNDYSLIPKVDTVSSFAISSKEVEEDDLQSILKIFKITVFKYTAPEDIMIFFYLYHHSLLDIVNKLEVKAYVAEPNLEKCEKTIEYWRKKAEVKRFTV